MGQLVDAVLAQEAPNGRDAVIALPGGQGISLPLGIVFVHGAEFDDLKDVAVDGGPLLPEEDGTVARQLQRRRRRQQNGTEQDQPRQAENNIEGTF